MRSQVSYRAAQDVSVHHNTHRSCTACTACPWTHRRIILVRGMHISQCESGHDTWRLASEVLLREGVLLSFEICLHYFYNYLYIYIYIYIYTLYILYYNYIICISKHLGSNQQAMQYLWVLSSLYCSLLMARISSLMMPATASMKSVSQVAAKPIGWGKKVAALALSQGIHMPCKHSAHQQQGLLLSVMTTCGLKLTRWYAAKLIGKDGRRLGILSRGFNIASKLHVFQRRCES